MTVDKILNEQLKKSVDAQRNMFNFIAEGTTAAMEKARAQQLEALKTSLSSAVQGGQIKEDMASKIENWYASLLDLQTQMLKLNRDHLEKSIEEFSHINKDSAGNLMQNYTDYLTQANSAYSNTVKTAQDVLMQGLANFKENSKPVVDAAAEVIKKTRTRSSKEK